MNKSITSQIEDMERQNEMLKSYRKLLDKAVLLEIGMTLKEVEKMRIEKEKFSTPKITVFDNKIREFFDLKTEQDMKDFIHIICTDSSKKYFEKKRTDSIDNLLDDEQG